MSDSGLYDSGRDFWDASVLMTPSAAKLHPSAAMITAPYEHAPVALTVLVLCRNNENTIIAALDTLVEAMEVIDTTYEIIVIDDASTDRSVELVRGYITEFPGRSVLLRANKIRKSTYANYVDGAFIGCGQYYRMVHGDNSEAVETMVDGMRALGEADIIIPYYISMLKKGLWERFRVNGFSWLVNLLSGNHINYYSSLQVHLRYNVMRWRAASAGSSFQAELLCQLLDLGFTFKQVPCRAVPQREDQGFRAWLGERLSAGHTLLELLIKRFSRHLHDGGD